MCACLKPKLVEKVESMNEIVGAISEAMCMQFQMRACVKPKLVEEMEFMNGNVHATFDARLRLT